jgi:hypothetical protein
MEVVRPPAGASVRVWPIPYRLVPGWGYLQQLDDPWRVWPSHDGGPGTQFLHVPAGFQFDVPPTAIRGYDAATGVVFLNEQWTLRSDRRVDRQPLRRRSSRRRPRRR